jgi:hypothetical protein
MPFRQVVAGGVLSQEGHVRLQRGFTSLRSLRADGNAIADEYDLENTANDVPEFVDVFTSVPTSGPFGGRVGNN